MKVAKDVLNEVLIKEECAYDESPGLFRDPELHAPKRKKRTTAKERAAVILDVKDRPKLSKSDVSGVLSEVDKELEQDTRKKFKAVSIRATSNEKNGLIEPITRYDSSYVTKNNTMEKYNGGKVKYHGLSYATLNDFGRDWALSPAAIRSLEDKNLTEDFLRETVEKDRAIWKGRNLYINGEYAGTIGDYTEKQGCYVELMQELFKYRQPSKSVVYEVRWTARLTNQ